MKKHIYILTLVLVCSQALSAISMSERLAGGVAQQSQKTDKFEAAGVLVAETISKDLFPLTHDVLSKNKALFASLLEVSLAPLFLAKLSPKQLDDCKEIVRDIATLAQEQVFSDKAQEALLKELIADVKKACLVALKERNQQNVAPCFVQEATGSLPARWNSIVEKMKADNPAVYEKVCAYQKKWEPMIANIMQSIVQPIDEESEQFLAMQAKFLAHQEKITQMRQEKASNDIVGVMGAMGDDERFLAIDSALGVVMPLLRTPADGMQLGKAVCNALEKNPSQLIQAANAFKGAAIPVICQIALDALDHIKERFFYAIG